MVSPRRLSKTRLLAISVAVSVVSAVTIAAFWFHSAGTGTPESAANVQVPPQSPALASAQPNPAPTDRELIEAKESLYNNILIYKAGPRVQLTFGYNRRIYTESTYNTEDPTELTAYPRLMTVGVMYPRNVGSILEIGLGGGRIASYLQHYIPNVAITSVELDPDVIRMAKKYFEVQEGPTFKIVQRDGRLFLTQDRQRYDIIMVDAYRGPFVPFHLVTKEFYELVRQHLSEGGIAIENIATGTKLFDATVKTLQSVFSQVEFYRDGASVITVSYEGPPRSQEELLSLAEERQPAFGFRYDLRDLLQKRQRITADSTVIDPKARILIDNFAPVESLHAIEENNRKWPDPL